MTLIEAKQEILRLRKENRQLNLRVDQLVMRLEMANSNASWDKEFLRSQIPENHEMGQ
jgi:hypothetical protein